MRQHLDVHAVGLDQQSEGLAKHRAHRHGLYAVCNEAPAQLAVVEAGGLDDSPLDAVPAQLIAQGAATGLIVGEAAGVPAGFEMCVEPALPDVKAGDNGGHDAGAEGRTTVAPLATLSAFMPCLSSARTDSGPWCPRIPSRCTGRVATGRPTSLAGRSLA